MAYQEALPESCMTAVVAEFGQPVELRELPVPELEHGALPVRFGQFNACSSPPSRPMAARFVPVQPPESRLAEGHPAGAWS